MTSTRENVPPLERGLLILRLLAQSESGLSYSEILERIDAPSASLARIIRVLRKNDYIVKSERGKPYRLGPAMNVFTRGESLPDRLKRAAEQVLPELMTTLGKSVALIYPDGLKMVFLAKSAHPNAPSMQPVGNRGDIVSTCPWGVLFFNELNSKNRDAALRNNSARAPQFMKSLDRKNEFLESHGFVYDDGDGEAHIRRLAVPVTNAEGAFVAAIGLAGIEATLSKREAMKIGLKLIEAASSISEEANI